MSYYETLAEDVERAKQILAKGRAEASPTISVTGGTIFAGDTYAAYMLLDSFVEAIEAVGPKVCELAVRHERMRAR